MALQEHLPPSRSLTYYSICFLSAGLVNHASLLRGALIDVSYREPCLYAIGSKQIIGLPESSRGSGWPSVELIWCEFNELKTLTRSSLWRLRDDLICAALNFNIQIENLLN